MDDPRRSSVVFNEVVTQIDVTGSATSSLRCSKDNLHSNKSTEVKSKEATQNQIPKIGSSACGQQQRSQAKVKKRNQPLTCSELMALTGAMAALPAQAMPMSVYSDLATGRRHFSAPSLFPPFVSHRDWPFVGESDSDNEEHQAGMTDDGEDASDGYSSEEDDWESDESEEAKHHRHHHRDKSKRRQHVRHRKRRRRRQTWLCQCFRAIGNVKKWISSQVKTLVEHRYFNRAILLCILFNTLSMGVEYHNQVRFLKLLQMAIISYLEL